MKNLIKYLALCSLLVARCFSQVSISWTDVDKAGSSLADLATRSASDLNSGTLNAARLPSTITQATTFSPSAGGSVAVFGATANNNSISVTRTGGTSLSFSALASDSYISSTGTLHLQQNGASFLTIGQSATTQVRILSGYQLNAQDTTASTSTTTGSAVFGGGIGVAGAGYFGGDIVAVANSGGSDRLTINANASGVAQAVLNAAAGSGTRAIRARTNGVDRWMLRFGGNNSESTGDAGTDFLVTAYTDAGASIDNPIYLTRAAGGSMTISRPMTLGGNLTFGTSGSILNGTPGSIGITATGTNQSFGIAPTGTGFVVLGSSTEKMGLNGGSLSFNRAISTGGIYDSTGFGYQFQHTKSTTAASDLLALGVYNTAGTLVTNNALAVNGAGNVMLRTATDSGNGTIQLATHTTSAGGIGFGPDTSIYRTAAGVLTTGTGGAAETAVLNLNGGTNATKGWNIGFLQGGTYYGSMGTKSVVIGSGSSNSVRIQSQNSNEIELGTLQANSVRLFANNTDRLVLNGVTGDAAFSSTTASTSTTTGAMTVGGGIGVAGAGYFGGSLTIAADGVVISNSGINNNTLSGGAFSLGSAKTGSGDVYLDYPSTGNLKIRKTGGSVLSSWDSSGNFSTSTLLGSTNTTEATAAGAGSINTLGGISSAKSIYSAGRIVNTAVKTTAYTVTTADHYLVGNHATVAFTITLIAAGSNAGREYWFKNKGAATVTIDGTSLGQIFDTSAVNTITLTTGQSAHLISDGATWLRMP